MDIRERLVQQYGDDELLFADGFDDAIIGVTVCTPHRVVYDSRLMVATLTKRDSMGYSDAWEFLDFNTFQAYVGERTPIYINTEQRCGRGCK